MRFRLVDQSLSVQFWLAGAVVAVLSLVSLGLILTQVRHQADGSRFLTRIHLTINRLNGADRALFEQHRALSVLSRGERLAEKDGPVERFRRAKQIWDGEIRELRRQGVSPLVSEGFLNNLNLRYERWYGVSQGLIARPTPKDQETEATVFGELTALVGDRIEAAESMVASREELEKSAVEKTFTAIALIEIGLLLLFAIVLQQLYNSIARPISDLQNAMQLYQGGDLSSRVEVASRSQVGFLQQHFNELAGTIEGMVGDLRRLDQMKSEFISTVSHELRTPLTSIAGYVKLMAAGDAGPINETQAEFLGILETNVGRLSRLINDIMDLESMESGRARLDRKHEDLASVLRECRQTLGLIANQKGLLLKFEVPDHLKPVLGDHARLVQVFTNLISNAIKYTPKGSVSVQAEEKDFAVMVRVRDTGVGLSAEEQARLFDKFYRTRSGVDSGETGNGLGLAIVRGLVEAHGGTIRVESEPGRGSVFTVTLPTVGA
jgi:signal transduction histidine kinase